MTKDEIIKKLRDMAKYPTVTLPRDCEALKAAADLLEQKEAKYEPVPVAIVEVFGKDWRLDYMALPVGKHKLYAQQYTYTTPPQRTWVGLTSEEKIIMSRYDLEYAALIGEVERKLKEKNS